jgi:hypothetical protein
MATNGVAAQQVLAPVLAAVETMQGNVDRARKEQAVQFLDKFQKTVGLDAALYAWRRLMWMYSRMPGTLPSAYYTQTTLMISPRCLQLRR